MAFGEIAHLNIDENSNLKVFVLARIVENFRKSAKNVGTVTK